VRLAVSNIAWDVTEDAAIAALLARYNVDAIDVAPGKYFPVPANATVTDIVQVRTWWADRGIDITGMQALLFGTSGLNVFGSAQSQNAMLAHLDGVCRIGAGLGATRVVFGSPKNRDRGALDDQQAREMAAVFFRRLGDIAQSQGVVICLEPNPPRYGANFMIDSDETVRMVEQVAHPAVRMQFDTGALAINGEDIDQVVARCAPLIGHVHASEPDLVPLGDGGTDHAKAAAALRHHLPGHIVTVEMVATKDEPHAVSIERALRVAISAYKKNDAGSGT
jgi:D-psicose/D-tagatose/L-ribulose 3-epimerase